MSCIRKVKEDMGADGQTPKEHRSGLLRSGGRRESNSCRRSLSELSRVWTLHIDDHRPTPSEKQNYLLALAARRIDIAVHRPRRDIEEISRANGSGIPSTRTTLEANRS